MRRMMTEKEIATVESLRKDGILSLKDSHGNPRFVEGDITMETIEGVTQTYGKWSLSGTHLMIMISANINNGTSLNNNIRLANITLPKFIFDKITPISSNNIDYKTFRAYALDWTGQNIGVTLSKYTNNLAIVKVENVTMDKDRSFRIQFDLLIDTDYDN